MESAKILKYGAPYLPDFTRRQWTSSAARAIWEPRITRIGAQFAAVERESVELDIRSAALQNIAPEQLPRLAKMAGKRGLAVIPLSTQGRPESYASSPVEIVAGRPWDYRIALTKIANAGAFVEAWDSGDHEKLGALLGYPACCRRFFLLTWAAGSVDPTWSMSDQGDGPLEANILLRWLGVRFVPHMPCGFHCRGTVELGRKLRKLFAPLEGSWADELLRMPMLWSSLNGIGEVVTPIVKLNFRSDVTLDLRKIRRETSSYPESGAYGLRFPYQPRPAQQIPDYVFSELKEGINEIDGRIIWKSTSHGDGPVIKHGDATPEDDPTLWLDNGFGSFEAMDRAHRVIMFIRPPTSPRTVLDLGCGNGLLGRKLAGAGGTVIGVEANPDRARRAEKYLTEVLVGDIFEFYLSASVWNPDLTLLMPGRIIESAEEKNVEAAKLASRFKELSGELLVYAYGDWLERYGSLENLCKAAGLEGELIDQQKGRPFFLSKQSFVTGVSAGVLKWA